MIVEGHACFRRAVFFLALLMLVYFAPGLVVAGELDEGMLAAEQGDYEKALRIFSPLAEAGNAEAQHNLAILYRSGHGVAKDLDKSRYWFLHAAEQGIAAAQYNLGYMYDMGEGVKQSDRYAFLWYRKAAEQGHSLAQTNLGVMYANGSGVAQDLDLAYVWFNLAAAQGYAAAFQNRQVLAEELTDEKRESLRALSREYFQQYVMPFQNQGMMRRPRR
ncbi:hypothetical protein MNBD_GAMMA20-1718 [hydrothermal vent metagenome]|uniref:Sel1 repeat family protein n=1 Tax=hydrothermal vent metagenome TaxID=652676 RepID=A0A3B1A0G0_9ZZZZ